MDWLKIRDLKDLQSILDLMQRNDLAELEIESDGQRLRLRRSEPPIAGERVVFHGEASAVPPPFLPQAADSAEPPPAETDDSLHPVISPLVGTFYRAPSPEADPFVEEGDKVEEETVLCIIEAMKVMNEIRASASGVVREILVKNGEPVEFGQPLFRLETV
ncbi:MAG: acetyl-CoA carboxylase biotin carboxyl carrier protein [Planctomycetota bacterium]|nr:acetyl-CoA carboxylase biotin carboxyl carrier protein [Planctomycetota bacterium]